MFKFIHILENIVKNLSDPDSQKNLLALATKIAELQEQNRLTQAKTIEVEKRSTVLMRERDQVLLENGRIIAAKAKLESLCRELHRHNQQIRVNYHKIIYLSSLIYPFFSQDESTQRQREDETKRRELATKFQVSIRFLFLNLFLLPIFFRPLLMKSLHNYPTIVKNQLHYENKIFNYPSN